jgi:hypothetical protein
MEFLVIARRGASCQVVLPSGAPLTPPSSAYIFRFNNALQCLPDLKRSAAAHLQLLLKLLNDCAYRSDRCRPEKP